MVGMVSFHDNNREDRRYRYFYQNSQNWALSGCEYTGYLNEYDKDLYFNLESGKVIAGNRWNYG